MRPLLLALLLTSCSGVTIRTGHDSRVTTLAELGWVIGSWETAPDEHGCVFSERWTRQSDTLFTGHGRQDCGVSHDPFEEELRLEGRADGAVYVASPAGHDPTEFPIERADGTRFLAVNEAHDFPTHVEYRHTESGIDAIVSGPDRSFTLSMHAHAD